MLREQARRNDDDQELGQKTAREDLRRLLEAVERSPGDPQLEDYFKMRESHKAAGLTTYLTMWTLFSPGGLVYARPFLNCPQLFVVESPPSMWDSENGTKSSTLNVDCWCYDWNGFEIVRVYHNIAIERFRGTKPINELTCYPAGAYQMRSADSEASDLSQLFRALVERGKKYEKFVKSLQGASQMFNYHGKALSHERDFMGRNNDDMVYVSSV
jgi:hypothetical protein